MRGTTEQLPGAGTAATGRTGCPAQQAPVQLHPSGSQSLRSRIKVRLPQIQEAPCMATPLPCLLCSGDSWRPICLPWPDAMHQCL